MKQKFERNKNTEKLSDIGVNATLEHQLLSYKTVLNSYCATLAEQLGKKSITKEDVEESVKQNNALGNKILILLEKCEELENQIKNNQSEETKTHLL